MPKSLETYPREALLFQLHNPELGVGPIQVDPPPEPQPEPAPPRRRKADPKRPVPHRWAGSWRGHLGDAE